MVSGTQCGSVPCGARAVITREPAYSFVPGLQPAAPALVHAATAFRKERRSRLPPKLESTARPAKGSSARCTGGLTCASSTTTPTRRRSPSDTLGRAFGEVGQSSREARSARHLGPVSERVAWEAVFAECCRFARRPLCLFHSLVEDREFLLRGGPSSHCPIKLRVAHIELRFQLL